MRKCFTESQCIDMNDVKMAVTQTSAEIYIRLLSTVNWIALSAFKLGKGEAIVAFILKIL